MKRELRERREEMKKLSKNKAVFWETKSGEKIKISELEDKHLINIVKLLKRKFDQEACHNAAVCYGHGFDGDSMASYYAEQEGDNWMEANFEDYLEVCENPVVRALIKELDKRKLSYE